MTIVPFIVRSLFQNNLSSLLKTAEDLRIKGLAEVSWRDDDGANNCSGDDIEKRPSRISATINSSHRHHHHSANNNNDAANSPIPSGTSSGATLIKSIPMPMMASPQHRHLENGSPIPTQMMTIVHHQPVKKKRGRPPLDGEYDSYSTPKIAHIDCAIPPYSAVSVMLDESSQDHTNLQHHESGSSAGRSPMTGDDHQQTWNENNLEMHMDYEEEISASQLIPKLERPDTPKSSDGYYENEPQSPGDDKKFNESVSVCVKRL